MVFNGMQKCEVLHLITYFNGKGISAIQSSINISFDGVYPLCNQLYSG